MSKYKIGLTGLIGSGKSLVANYFANFGIDVIDTDIISHELTNTNGTAMPLIIKEFGQKYITLDGALNRSLMRELIFSHKHEKLKLESILHPLIFDEVVASVSRSNSLYTVIVVPLLFQSPRYMKYMNRSIFVDCSENIIIDRVIKRNGWSKDMVLAVLSSQMPRAEQMKLTNDVLDNNKTILDLKSQVNKLHGIYNNLVNARL
ncbi:MAG: dephospho-CoA kinase [Burkholderiales bacterium]|jgi:dephospho-CoA kinase|nr:dephospho-CoA kinase [Burkholderiales bacterium]